MASADRGERCGGGWLVPCVADAVQRERQLQARRREARERSQGLIDRAHAMSAAAASTAAGGGGDSWLDDDPEIFGPSKSSPPRRRHDPVGEASSEGGASTSPPAESYLSPRSSERLLALGGTDTWHRVATVVKMAGAARHAGIERNPAYDAARKELGLDTLFQHAQGDLCRARVARELTSALRFNPGVAQQLSVEARQLFIDMGVSEVVLPKPAALAPSNWASSVSNRSFGGLDASAMVATSASWGHKVSDCHVDDILRGAPDVQLFTALHLKRMYTKAEAFAVARRRRRMGDSRSTIAFSPTAAVAALPTGSTTRAHGPPLRLTRHSAPRHAASSAAGGPPWSPLVSANLSRLLRLPETVRIVEATFWFCFIAFFAHGEGGARVVTPAAAAARSGAARYANGAGPPALERQANHLLQVAEWLVNVAICDAEFRFAVRCMQSGREAPDRACPPLGLPQAPTASALPAYCAVVAHTVCAIFPIAFGKSRRRFTRLFHTRCMSLGLTLLEGRDVTPALAEYTRATYFDPADNGLEYLNAEIGDETKDDDDDDDEAQDSDDADSRGEDERDRGGSVQAAAASTALVAAVASNDALEPSTVELRSRGVSPAAPYGRQTSYSAEFNILNDAIMNPAYARAVVHRLYATAAATETTPSDTSTANVDEDLPGTQQAPTTIVDRITPILSSDAKRLALAVSKPPTEAQRPGRPSVAVHHPRGLNPLHEADISRRFEQGGREPDGSDTHSIPIFDLTRFRTDTIRQELRGPQGPLCRLRRVDVPRDINSRGHPRRLLPGAAEVGDPSVEAVGVAHVATSESGSVCGTDAPLVTFTPRSCSTSSVPLRTYLMPGGAGVVEAAGFDASLSGPKSVTSSSHDGHRGSSATQSASLLVKADAVATRPTAVGTARDAYLAQLLLKASDDGDNETAMAQLLGRAQPHPDAPATRVRDGHGSEAPTVRSGRQPHRKQRGRAELTAEGLPAPLADETVLLTLVASAKVQRNARGGNRVDEALARCTPSPCLPATTANARRAPPTAVFGSTSCSLRALSPMVASVISSVDAASMRHGHRADAVVGRVSNASVKHTVMRSVEIGTHLAQAEALEQTRHEDDESLQDKLSQAAERRTEVARAQRAAHHRIDDALRTVLADPFRTSEHANAIVARSPPKVAPDPTRHPECVRGSLLAGHAKDAAMRLGQMLRHVGYRLHRASHHRANTTASSSTGRAAGAGAGKR